MPVGPEVTEYGKGEVDPLRPGLQAWNVVRKHTQNLGVEFREEVFELLERGKLSRSDRCERCR